MKTTHVALAVALTVPLPAAALSISYSTALISGNLWQYTYEFDNAAFNENEGVSIFFDYQLYGPLSNPLPSSDPGWDTFAIDPDPLNSFDGFYDLLALADGPSLAGPFSVQFEWLGSGTPGAQPFETYTCNDADCFDIRITGRGMTAPTGDIPVPAPLALIAAGLGMLGLGRRHLASVKTNATGGQG